MAKGVCVSKTVAVATGILTVSLVCGVALMLVIYQIQYERSPPVRPPSVLPTTPMPTGPPPTLRLPDTLLPESYAVFLQPLVYARLPDNTTRQSFSFRGNATARLKCARDARSIFLHAHRLNLTDVRVTEAGSKEQVSVKGFRIHDNESDFLEIQLNHALLANTTYDLFTEFNGELLDDLSGFYLSRYAARGEDEEDQSRFLATSQTQPTGARKVFPCWDEPARKAVFNITVTHRLGTAALSNTPGDGGSVETIDGEDWIVTRFRPTPLMSTYLLAVTVSDFMEKMKSGTKIKIFARPDAVMDGQADYALEITQKILTYYEDKLGVKYPLQKLDQIAVPDLAVKAVESWGLLSYQESALLLDTTTSSIFDRQTVATAVAHELAHQWFGNLVTMRWWSGLWLKEGFATYMSYYGVEAADWHLEDFFVLSEVQPAFQADSLNSSRALRLSEQEVQSPSQIAELFDDISSGKAAAVLRMLSQVIGHEVFMRGVQKYLLRFQYNSTDYTDLWECLQEEAKESVESLMSSWVEQAGHPVVSIDTRSGDTWQQQSLLLDSTEHGVVWQVPIRYITSRSVSAREDWLEVSGPVRKPNFIMDSSGEWLLANVNCSGFYRVNYDEDNWAKLQMQLESDYKAIPPVSRGQLIDDAFNLARAGRLNVTVALGLTRYLLNDTQYVPWESARKNLEYLTLMFDRSEVYGPLTKYLQRQVRRIYADFQNHTASGTVPEGHQEQYVQVTALSVACGSGLPDCGAAAKDLFREYRNGTNRIHPNLRRAIYCAAIAAGDADDWEFAWREFQKATVAAEKDKLRFALSCSKEIWLLNRYLHYTLDPDKIRKMDAASTISFIAQNVAGQPLAWDFVRGNWAFLTQEYGAAIISPARLIDAVTRRFSTGFELQQLKQLRAEQGDLHQETATRALEQAVERTESNMQWVRENQQVVLSWLSGELTEETP